MRISRLISRRADCATRRTTNARVPGNCMHVDLDPRARRLWRPRGPARRTFHRPSRSHSRGDRRNRHAPADQRDRVERPGDGVEPSRHRAGRCRLHRQDSADPARHYRIAAQHERERGRRDGAERLGRRDRRWVGPRQSARRLPGVAQRAPLSEQRDRRGHIRRLEHDSGVADRARRGPDGGRFGCLRIGCRRRGHQHRHPAGRQRRRAHWLADHHVAGRRRDRHRPGRNRARAVRRRLEHRPRLREAGGRDARSARIFCRTAIHRRCGGYRRTRAQ